MADIITTVQDGEILELAYNVVNTSPHVGRQQQVELLAPDGTVIDSDAILLEAEDSERGVLRTGALSDTNEGIYEVVSEEGSRTIQVYIDIPDSVVSRPSDNSTTTFSSKYGVVIETKSDWSSIGSRISINTSGQTRGYLHNYDETNDAIGTLIADIDLSGKTSGDTFTFDNVNLVSGNKYMVLLDAEGASYTVGYNNSVSSSDFPFTSASVDITSRWNGFDQLTDQKDITAVNDIGNTGFA